MELLSRENLRKRYVWKSKTYGSVEELYPEMRRMMEVVAGLGFVIIEAKMEESKTMRFDSVEGLE